MTTASRRQHLRCLHLSKEVMELLVIFLTLAIAFSRADLQEKRESRYGDGDGVKSCPSLHLGPSVNVDPPTCKNNAQPSGTRCHFFCKKGYRVRGPPMTVCQDDGSWFFGHRQITCVDINECRFRNGGCSHRCHNYEGGYHCECPRPFVLAKDRKTCRAVGLVLNCSAHNIEITIPKYALNDLQGNYLRLRDPSCHARENKTHYIFKTELKGCGTTRRHVRNFFVYSNRVTERKVVHKGLVTRVGQGEFNIPFCCYYLDNAIVSAVGYKPFVRELVLKEKGYGKFKLRMDFFHSKKYQSVYTWNDYPVSVYLRERLYFEVSVDSIDQNLVIFAENCFATPTRDHKKAGRLRYPLIHEGCIVDSTTQTESSPSPHKQRFSVEALKFVGRFPFVYLHCSVVVCKASNPSSRCSKGCIPGAYKRTQSQSDAKAVKTHVISTRAVKEQVVTEKKEKDRKYILSKGPVSLIDDEPKIVRGNDKNVAEDQPSEDEGKKLNELETNMEKEQDADSDKSSAAASTSNIMLIVLTALTVMALIGVMYIGRKVKQAKDRGMPNYRPMKS